MSCVAQLPCHVKVKGNDVYLLGTGVIKFEVTKAFFQLLKGLFLSFINSLRFNGYKELKYTILAYGRAVFFFLSCYFSYAAKLENLCFRGQRKAKVDVEYSV